MVLYSFYTDTFFGKSIPEDDWDELEKRAEDRLAKFKRLYTVTAPDNNAEAMAVCAMADALYYFDAVNNGEIVNSSSIGSVSSSGGGVSIDTTPAGQARELYRCAQEYLDIYRGAGC